MGGRCGGQGSSGKVVGFEVQHHPSARTGKKVDVSKDWFG